MYSTVQYGTPFYLAIKRLEGIFKVQAGTFTASAWRSLWCRNYILSFFRRVGPYAQINEFQSVIILQGYFFLCSVNFAKKSSNKKERLPHQTIW